jgi:archaeal type IV pilus assembly protein PilA
MKILRSRKALSPVEASIILIAVTVAVSIAVAAWMGALTFNFMATEQGQISQLTFITGATPSLNATFLNTGTTPITISQLWINNVQQSGTLYWNATGTNSATGSTYTIAGNSMTTLGIVSFNGVTIVSGAQYAVKLVSSKGNTFPLTSSAPS